MMSRFQNITENLIYYAADPQFAQFRSRRSVVHSTKGIVSCTQPLAAQAGLTILKAGGNAADAAVATAAALNVTEPSSTGIGGDLFCLFWNEKTKSLQAVNGSGRAPARLTLDKIRQDGITGDNIPFTSIHSATVPGAAAGWVSVVEKLGSGKLTMKEILTPATDLAEEGFPVSEITAHSWVSSERRIKTASRNAAEMLKNGKAPRPGDVFRNPTLARTFRELAAKGKDGFYKGRVAEAIVQVVQELGGVMTLEDLANHETTFDEPISQHFRGVDIWECPPNGQGIVALQALGIIKVLEEKGVISKLENYKHNSAEYLHIIIEALRYAFADANEYVADPRVEKVPLKEMLSPAYLEKRAARFSPKQHDANLKHGNPVNSTDTVYFSVTDSDGNACSFIISNYAGFGTAVIPKGCGFTLQNRGAGFSLTEGHLNCLKPNKRPYHTIIPAMITKDGNFHTCFGVMGGFMQPQGHVQVLLNMLAFHQTPQAALDAPRICVQPGAKALAYANAEGNAEQLTSQSVVAVEDGIDQEVIEGLKKLGHDIDRVEGWQRGLFGRGQIIRAHRDVDGDRVYSAGSDPRGDGHAVPW